MACLGVMADTTWCVPDGGAARLPANGEERGEPDARVLAQAEAFNDCPVCLVPARPGPRCSGMDSGESGNRASAPPCQIVPWNRRRRRPTSRHRRSR
jgi:hypothetical protein